MPARNRRISRPSLEILDSYLWCRLVRHQWVRNHNDEWANANLNLTEIRLSVICTGCSMLRREVWDRRTMKRLGQPQYVPPAGYNFVLPEHEGQSAIEVFRLEYIARDSELSNGR